MHLVTHGSGSPLVLIHGFGVDHRILLPLDPAVEAHGGWRRIYLDLPSMGGTSGDGVTCSEDVVVAVERAIRDEIGSEPFAVLGSSYGGMIARRVAHDLREQVLGLATVAAICAPAGGARDLPPRTVLTGSVAERDAQWFAEVWAGTSSTARTGTGGDPARGAEAERVDDPGLDGYREMAVVPSPEGLAAYRQWVQPGVDAVDVPALQRIAERYGLDAEPEQTAAAPFDRPTLLLTGRQDHVVGFADAWRLLTHYPRGTFVVLDEAGHNVHLDQPEQTAAAITGWLDRMRR
ncbi:MAG TPA: alpha/beta hydrolase [Cellulomonas sp.]